MKKSNNGAVTVSFNGTEFTDARQVHLMLQRRVADKWGLARRRKSRLSFTLRGNGGVPVPICQRISRGTVAAKVTRTELGQCSMSQRRICSEPVPFAATPNLAL